MKTLLVAGLLAQFVSSHAPVVEPGSTAGGLAWTAPKGWTVAPSASSMRVATYRVPAAAGDAEGAEMAIFYFGQGQGGSVDSNVERWFAQFTPEKGSAKRDTKKAKIGGLDVTLVSTEGTYAAGMPGGPTTPKSGYALHGAIADGGKGPVFFKLTGPKKSVDAAAAAFDALVKSLKKS